MAVNSAVSSIHGSKLLRLAPRAAVAHKEQLGPIVSTADFCYLAFAL